MSRWQRVKHHVDKALGFHIFHLEEPSSGAQHKLQILISHDSCPTCGHVIPKTNTGEIDPFAIERAELALLNKVHENMDAYIRRTGAPVKKK